MKRMGVLAKVVCLFADCSKHPFKVEGGYLGDGKVS